MILIISDNNERTTTEVIRWLVSMKKTFIRIHEDEILEIKAHQNRFFLESKRNKFFLDEINSVWYRRGNINFKRLLYKNISINLSMNETQYWLRNYVINNLESKKHINKQSNSDVNKLLVLEKAKEVGLDVPDYFLATNDDNVQFEKTIIKTINGNAMIDDIEKNADGIMYTAIVCKKEEEDFFITFFQEKIEKDYEIRSFYLNGDFFSMAIFSQNDEKTKTDFRKYNHEKPNRTVRFNLPKAVEEKAHNLMQKLDLNSVSIDFMKSGDKFYFLEINPVGQFGFVSTYCNYILDNKIANYL